MEVAPRESQASREGGCGVAGWQGLKMESGDIADLMPRYTRRPSGVEDNAFFKKGRMMRIGTLGQLTIYDN
jgi:hypothetical protein